MFRKLVQTDATGHRRVAYHGLIGPLIEAVKELDDHVRALDNPPPLRGECPLRQLEALQAGDPEGLDVTPAEVPQLAGRR